MASATGQLVKVMFDGGRKIVTPMGELTDFCEVPVSRLRPVPNTMMFFAMPSDMDIMYPIILAEVMPPPSQWTRP